MKRTKKISIVLSILFVAICSVALFGCGGGLNVTFDYNYTGSPGAIVKEAKSGEKLTPPEVERTGYTFDGWYTTKDCVTEYDFESTAITRELTVYASWTRTSYRFTFDYNYDTDDTVTTVAVGGKATRPAAPTREGYLFSGWYTDEACTTEYDFSATLTDDVTVYAKWEADSGDNVTLTLMWNYEGAENPVYDTIRLKKGGRGQETIPVREGYYFNGWYTDAAATGEAYDLMSRQNENRTLYADWYYENTFEAEYVNLDGLVGHGISGVTYDKGLIVKDEFGANASNGYYIGWLYNPGIKLTFNVHSETAVTKAQLALRLSAEVQNTTINGSDFKVSVNGKSYSYSIDFTGVPSTGSGSRKPFETYIISTNVSLDAGDNTIELLVNNNKSYGFTVNANAPMVDAVYIYSKTEVTWAEGYPLISNLEGK